MTPDTNSRGRSLNILLVEDREEDVFFFRRALANVGAEVSIRVVENGTEAQAYLEGEKAFADRNYYPFPDIIVCDFKMPRRGGVEFLQWLRKKKQFERLPFVLLSGSALPEEKDLALRMGASMYLRKTADFANMLENARQILKLLNGGESQNGATENPPQNRRPVLVVDDEPQVRRMIADVLEKHGFEALPAESSSEAVACARRQRPDVVLCDVMLPDAMGTQTVAALREIPGYADIPVILMTGFPYMEKYLGSPKPKLLLKPLSAKALVDAINAALATKNTG